MYFLFFRLIYKLNNDFSHHKIHDYNYDSIILCMYFFCYVHQINLAHLIFHIPSLNDLYNDLNLEFFFH